MDRLDAMQVLLAVVDEGSLSAGGRKLNVPLQTVSRKVTQLERYLGTQLLIRTSREVRLTDAGQDYVAAARSIVAKLEEAKRRASGEYEQPRGELTIAVPGETGRVIASPLICEFARQNPAISLDVRSLDRPVDLVGEGVDVSIQFGKIADESLYAVMVADLAIFTCASPAYCARKGCPMDPGDLAGHDGILYRSQELNHWIYSVNGEVIECLPNFQVRANNASTCRVAAVEGLGIVRLFHWYLDGDLQSGALVRILEEYECASWQLYLVYAKQGPLPLKVRAFLDWMTPRLKSRLRPFNIARRSF